MNINRKENIESKSQKQNDYCASNEKDNDGIYCILCEKNCSGVCSEIMPIDRIKMIFYDCYTEEVQTNYLHQACGGFRYSYIFEEHLNEMKDKILLKLNDILKKNIEDQTEVILVIFGLLAITLGKESNILFKQYKGKLIKLLKDPNQPISLRTKAATTIGCFAIVMDDTCKKDIPDLMNALYSVFKGSLIKKGEKISTYDEDLQILHASALKSWSFLLWIYSEKKIIKLRYFPLQKIPKLLESSSPVLKSAAEGAIIMNYDKMMKNMPDVEHRAKCQSLMEDIGKKEDVPPYKKESYGVRLNISSWWHKYVFDFLTNLLGNGMKNHLLDNPLLMNIFCYKSETRDWWKMRMGDWYNYMSQCHQFKLLKREKKAMEDVVNMANLLPKVFCQEQLLNKQQEVISE